MTSPSGIVQTHAVAGNGSFFVTQPIKIGAELFARHAGCGLYVRTTLGGNLPPRLPIADDALRDAYRVGQLADPSGGFDG